MYNHHLQDMAELVAQKLQDKELTTENVKGVLKNYWKDKIAIVWGIEDIIERAKEEFDYDLSEDDARKILSDLLDNHDCSYGINWDVIDFYLDRPIE